MKRDLCSFSVKLTGGSHLLLSVRPLPSRDSPRHRGTSSPSLARIPDPQSLWDLRIWLLFNPLCFGGVGVAAVGKSEQNLVWDVITLVGMSSLFSSNTARWVKVKVTQLCPTLCDPMDYTVCGILQTRILEWVAFPFSRESSQPRDRTQVSWIAGGFFTCWATREAQDFISYLFYK